MNKSELIAAVAAKADLSKKDAEAAVKAVIDSVSEALADGDKVVFDLFGLEGAVEAGDVDGAEIISRLGDQVLFQSPLCAHKQKRCIRVLFRHQLRQGDGRVHMPRRAAAGEDDVLQCLFHIVPSLCQPALVGFICLETLRTIPISASWMESAVPP